MNCFRKIQIISILIAAIFLLGCVPSNAKKSENENLSSSKNGMSNNPEALKFYNIGIRHLIQNSFDSAIDFFEEATRIDPSFSAAFADMGTAYSGNKDYYTALEKFKKAIELDSSYPRVFYNRAHTYFEMEKYDEALNDYNKAAEIDPGYYFAYKGRGFLYYKLKKMDLALRDYNKALELNQDDSDLYFRRGLLYLTQEMEDMGISDFTKASKLDPSDFAPLYNLACIYSMKKDYIKAHNFLILAMEKGFKDIDYIKKDQDLENFRNSGEYLKFLGNLK